MLPFLRLRCVVRLLPALLLTSLLQAQAIRTGFPVSGTQARSDDTFTGPIPIGFGVNFFGSTYSNLYVGTNGYVTFDRGQTGYNPENLINYQQKIIAPFYGDVDTRSPQSGEITWGSGSINGRPAFVVTWNNVGYYPIRADKTNTIQLVILSRSDRATDDFDFEFNYSQIQWEAGNANGGLNGLCTTGCKAPTVGYSNGLAGPANRSFEQRGSHMAGAFLDSNTSTGLRYQQSGGSGINGRLLFTVSNGAVSGGGTGTGGGGAGGGTGTGAGFCSVTGGSSAGGVSLIDGPVCTGPPPITATCPFGRPGSVTSYGSTDPLVMIWFGLGGLTPQSSVRARFSFNGAEQPTLDYGPFGSFQSGSIYSLCPSFVPNAGSVGPWTLTVYVNSSPIPFMTVSFTVSAGAGSGTGGTGGVVPSNSTSFGPTCAASFPGSWNTNNVGGMAIDPVRTDGLLTGRFSTSGGVLGNGFVIGRVLTGVTNGANGFLRWLMTPSGTTMVGLPNAFFGPGDATKFATNPPSFPVVPCLGTDTAALWVGQWDTVPFGSIRARMNMNGSVTFTVPQNCDFPGGTFTGTASGLGLTGTYSGSTGSGTFSLAFPSNDIGNFSGSYSVGGSGPQPWSGRNRSNGLIPDFLSDRGFNGRWYTPYGLLTLKVTGSTVTGTYPNGGTVTGSVSQGNLGPPDFGGGVTLTGSYSDLSSSGSISLRINAVSAPQNDPYPQTLGATFYGSSTNSSGFSAPWVGARAGDWSGTWSTQLGTMTGSQRGDGKWVFRVGGYTFVGNATNAPAGGNAVSGQFIGPFGGGGFVFSLNQDGVSFSGSVAAWSHLGLYGTLQATHVSDTIGPIDLCSTIRPVTTITTVPSGLQVRVDLDTLTAPVMRTWPSGEGHGFSTPSPQTLNSVQYDFSLWNYTLNAGGGILAPPSSTTYTAVFKTGNNGAGPGGLGGIWTSPNGPIRIIPTGGNTVEGLFPAGGPGGFSGFTCTVSGNTCTGTAFTPNGPPGTITITVTGPSLTGTITRPGGGGTIPVSGTSTGPSSEPAGPRVTFSPVMTTIHQNACNGSLPDPTKTAFYTNDANITHWVSIAGVNPGDFIGVTYTGPGGVRYFGQTPTNWSSIWVCFTLPVAPATAPQGNWTVSLSVNNQPVQGTAAPFTLSAPPPGQVGTGGGSGTGGSTGGGTAGSGTPATGPGTELVPGGGTGGGGAGGGGTPGGGTPGGGTPGGGTGGGTPAACPSNPGNIAIGKAARQSSTAFSGPAELGNNGILESDYGFHTDEQVNPFWQVDLGQTSTVCGMRLYNRINAGYIDRARTIAVLASDDDVTYRTIYRHDGSIWGAGGVPLTPTFSPFTARYVRLRLEAPERLYFHLREVEIYGVVGGTAGGGGTPGGGAGGTGMGGSGASATLTVPASANIYAAGRTAVPAFTGGGGTLPPVYALPTGSAGQALTVTNVSGTFTGCRDCVTNGPDGSSNFGGTNSDPNADAGQQQLHRLGISGIRHDGTNGFLIGVFTNGQVPGPPPPPAVNFTSIAGGASFSPLLFQTFYVGDGLTGTGSGSVQQFVIPAGATQFYLGFADGFSFSGFPAYYGDNSGQMSATVQVGTGTGGSGGTGTDACAGLILTPAGQPFNTTSGTSGFSVKSTCAWTATKNADWIQITAGQNGNGDGTVSFSVAANPGVPRNGTITVGGKTFSVFQNGTTSGTTPGCNYSLQSAATQSFSQAGGTNGLVRFLTNQTCAWTVTVVYPPGMGSGWITAAPVAGSANGAVSFTVAANSGNARQGAIVIAGQNVAILQEGVPPTPPGGGGTPGGGTVPPGTPAISTGGVVNAASYAPGGPPNGLAQGSFFSIFGTSVGPAEPVQAGYPLPPSLGGVTVQILAGGNTFNAYLVFVSAGQINGLLPSNLPPGPAQMTVIANGRTSAQAAILINPTSFGAFFQVVEGNNLAIAQNVASATDYPLNLPSSPAKPGQIVILWGTGLGPISGADNVAPGSNAFDMRGAPTNLQVAITVGGQAVPVQNILYAGRQAESAGVDNVYFTLPTNAPLGCNVPVAITVGGIAANVTTIAITADGLPCR